MLEVGHRWGALAPSAVFAVSSAIWLLFAGAGSARAESALRLPYPEIFGTIPASTYDANHQRVGDANLVVENLDDARVRVLVESGIEGGASTVATAELMAVDNGKFLKLLKQESRSIDANGIPMGVLSIDHESGVASCNKPDGGRFATEQITLPQQDRVANVPLNLLFQPLVEGTTDAVTFQLLLCRFGARLIDIDARIVPRDHADEEANPIIEVEYKPSFGRFVSLVAEKWVPKFSIWFDPRVSNPWVAHRIPLYSKGPEVFVIRDGIPNAWLRRSN
jgi:hypothetical protein